MKWEMLDIYVPLLSDSLQKEGNDIISYYWISIEEAWYIGLWDDHEVLSTKSLFILDTKAWKWHFGVFS